MDELNKGKLSKQSPQTNSVSKVKLIIGVDRYIQLLVKLTIVNYNKSESHKMYGCTTSDIKCLDPFFFSPRSTDRSN